MILFLAFLQMAHAAQEAPKPATASPAGGSAVESILSEELILSLKDPFQIPTSLLVKKEVPKSEMETFPLKDYKLNGVVTGPKKTRAMITAPNNKTFFVKVGDKIGVRDGTITQIHPDAIRIVEYDVDANGKRMPDVYELRVTGDLVSLTKREDE